MQLRVTLLPAVTYWAGLASRFEDTVMTGRSGPSRQGEGGLKPRKGQGHLGAQDFEDGTSSLGTPGAKPSRSVSPTGSVPFSRKRGVGRSLCGPAERGCVHAAGVPGVVAGAPDAR